MSLSKDENNTCDIKILLRNFLESSGRQKKSIANAIENRVEDIYSLGEETFKIFDRENEDWSVGWLLQILKRHKPDFFKKYNSNQYFNWVKTSSDYGLDFSMLQKFLVQEDFENADRLTSSFLRTLAGEDAVKRGYVFYSEVTQMPSNDLASIDKLWFIYSQGKFGFSVQANILKSVGKRYDKLWPRIGWKLDGIWTRYPSSFNWSLSAPEGHMPLINQLRGVRLMDSILKHPAISGRHKIDL